MVSKQSDFVAVEWRGYRFSVPREFAEELFRIKERLLGPQPKTTPQKEVSG